MLGRDMDECRIAAAFMDIVFSVKIKAVFAKWHRDQKGPARRPAPERG